MKINSKNVIKILEQFAPQKYAQEWDNVGFQIGNSDSQIDKIMTALEVTDEVIQEAIDESVDLIIVHHPLIFKSIKSVINSDPVGSMILKLIQNRINLIVAHTNLDSSEKGMNYFLANRLNIERLSNLTDGYINKYYKIAFYIPTDYREKVIHMIEQVNTGVYGNYQGCTYSVEGKGTFRPVDGAIPAIGIVGELETVEEIKIEIMVEESKKDLIIKKILSIHPYEEPAYDVIYLENQMNNPNMGLVGYLNKTQKLEDFADELKILLKADAMRVVKSNDKMISKVALCTGASSDFIEIAYQTGADVFITGDLKYHEAQFAKALGLNLIDAGHYETEQYYIQELTEILKIELEKKSYDVILFQSKLDINPFKYI
ncbi:MAG: Nif3-like dinuclear metal center hexameric protein [Clostridiales bacterium]|nr:Nif3-like dinuclear metal center hexameric protein [Clostridiales bacterium]